MATLAETLAVELTRLLEPLLSGARDEAGARRLLRALGLDDDADGGAAFKSMLVAAATLRPRIEALMVAQDLGAVAALLGEAADFFEAAAQLDGSTAPELERLGPDLLALLTGVYLRNHYPRAAVVGSLLTLVELADDGMETEPVIVDGAMLRAPVPYTRLRWDRLKPLLTDPVAMLQGVYAPNGLKTVADAEAMADALFPRLALALSMFGLTSAYGVADEDRDLLGDAAPLADHALDVYLPEALTGDGADAGVTLMLSPEAQGGLGLVVSPFGILDLETRIAGWRLEARLGGDVDAFAVGPDGATLLGGTAGAGMTARLAAERAPTAADGPAYLFGAADGTRLEARRVAFSLDVQIDGAGHDVILGADIGPVTLVVAPKGDGLLAGLLGSGEFMAQANLGLVWSTRAGLSIRGGAGLGATVPVGASVGPLTIRTVHVTLAPGDLGLVGEVSVEIAAKFGPVTLVLGGVGLSISSEQTETGGSFGAADLAIAPKLPNAIAVVVDAGGLTGGGSLFRDPSGVYAGVLQLSLQDRLSLTAVGLIAIGDAAGDAGFSLLVMGTVQGFQPIPLGFGFSLTGLGVLFGANRTFDEATLRRGLKDGKVGTLLFPKDPAANAPAVIAAYAAAFPVRRGSYLLGLLAQICWPTPPLLRMELALVLELGARRRLLALGRISALLPSEDNDLVRINLDAMGVVDLDQARVAIDGVLVDSRLAHRFPLTGAMAMRARLSGSDPQFALAIGGLNPRAPPPESLPPLPRIAIALTSGDNPRLTCEAYFAVTSNTVQFGARAELYAGAYGFSIEGHVGFDVLLELTPLYFIGDFDTSIQLKRGSSNLFKVGVSGSLEGPRPLKVSGKASFEICWCDFSIRFNKTLVDGPPPPPPPAVDVGAELLRALSAPEAWASDGPGGQGVALASTGAGRLVLDPGRGVAVRQRIAPLNTDRDLDLFGGAPITGARRFNLRVDVGGQTPLQTPLKDQFAPAQFFRMEEDEKLAAPAYQSMGSGLTLGAETRFSADQSVEAPLGYDTFVLDDGYDPEAPLEPRHRPTAPQVSVSLWSGAAGRGPMRRMGLMRFDNPDAPPGVQMTPEAFVVMPVDASRSPAPTPPASPDWSAQHAVAVRRERRGARWAVLPIHELETV